MQRAGAKPTARVGRRTEDGRGSNLPPPSGCFRFSSGVGQ